MKLKKIAAVGLAAMLAVAAPLSGAIKDPLSITAKAFEWASANFEVGDFEYSVYSDDRVELSSYNGNDSTVSLPTSVIIPASTEIYHPIPIPEGTEVEIQSVSYNAFPETVTDITVDSDNEYFSAKDGVLYSKDEKEIIAVPGGKTSLNIPKTVENIAFFEDYNYHDTQSFDNLTTITVEDGNTTYKAVDNVLYSADGTYLWLYPASKTDTEFVIPEGVETIDRGIYNDNLKSITLPSTFEVLHADDYFNYSVQLSSPFMECPQLETISVSANNPYYASVDGVLYSKDMSWMLVYPNQKKDKEFTIPSETFRFEFTRSPLAVAEYTHTPFTGNPYIEKITFLNPYFNQPPLEVFDYKGGVTGGLMEMRFSGCDKLKTIAGYTNSTTDEYVKNSNATSESLGLSEKYKLTFKSLGEFPTLKDTTTDDATAKEFEVAGLPEKFKDCKLKVDILESYEETENKRLTWDIYLVDADGKKIDTSDLGTTVTVKLPVPTDTEVYWSNYAVVYHIANDGTKTLLPSLVGGNLENGRYIVYTTNHFSRFTAGNTSEDVPEKFDSISDPDTESDMTSDTSTDNQPNHSGTVPPGDTALTSDTTSGSDKTSDTTSGSDQKGTGVALAIAPVILACAVVAVASKKKK